MCVPSDANLHAGVFLADKSHSTQNLESESAPCVCGIANGSLPVNHSTAGNGSQCGAGELLPAHSGFSLVKFN